MADNNPVSNDSKNLNDDEIKLVAYYIVSIQPDAERVLPNGIGSVMVTTCMTEDEFIAWVIARYFDNPENREALLKEEKCKAVPDKEDQYLRVSYSVIDRWDKPCYDWEEERVMALRSIHDSLLLESLPPAVEAPAAEAPAAEAPSAEAPSAEAPSAEAPPSPAPPPEAEEALPSGDGGSEGDKESDKSPTSLADLKTMILEALTAVDRFLTLESLAKLCDRSEDEIKVCVMDLKYSGQIRQVVNRYGLPKPKSQED